MAVEDRREAHALAERLEMRPYSYDFFQAVRRLECVHRSKPRVGMSLRASDDPVRFCQEPFLAFAASTMGKFDRGDRLHAPQCHVSFMGMLGPNGPLPLHLTEYARDRLRNHNDPTFARFLDLFNHRMVSLFYRAWANNQQAVSFDRPEEDRFAAYVGSLFGIGMESYVHRGPVPDLAKLHYAGRLSAQTRNAEGLAAILGDFFGIPVKVFEFMGRWIGLPKDCRCRLGESRSTGTLGGTAVVGAKIWDCQGNFRILLGPLDYVNYERMLPGGDSFARLVGWVRQYIGDELAWDVQIGLQAAEVPDLRLGQVGKLGWSTWLKSQPVEKDVVDLVIRPLAS